MVQIISIVVAFLFLSQVLYYTAKNKLQDQQALLWLLLAFAGIILALLLPLMNHAAEMLNIEYMPSLIFVIAFLIVLTILVSHTTTITKQQTQIKNLAQHLAYSMKHIDDLRQEIKKGEQKHDID